MAAYEFLASIDTLQIIGTEITRPANRITARAVTSQVVFSDIFAPYPADPLTGTVLWTPENIALRLSELAGFWDTNAALPGVLGISTTQEVDANGELFDVALVTVSSTSGLSTTQITVNAIDFLPSRFAPHVETTRAQLDATEAA